MFGYQLWDPSVLALVLTVWTRLAFSFDEQIFPDLRERGREIREDIAEVAGDGFEKVLSEANKVKHRTGELYENALAKGGEVLDVVHSGASAIKSEMTSDISKVSAIVGVRSSRAIF